MNTNNGTKWRRFIMPEKVEQINDHLSTLNVEPLSRFYKI